ncbi:MAG: RNA degradosome polyphosphate kinase, partial [Sedimenticola sp.]|nr:RNA degradosome polyphosphate kinase [Sedimenticola sp.]
MMSDTAKKMDSEAVKSAKTASNSNAEVPAAEDQVFDLDASEFYLNRELTWLEFNKRVLHEAADERTPLLERLKFIAIVSANMDEFFMKRLGGLKQQVGAGVATLTVDGRTPQQQINESSQVVRDIETVMRENYLQVTQLLEEKDIAIITYDHLNKEDKSYLRNYYYENIYPLVTPQSIDPAHPFPFISNLSLNLLVLVRYPGNSDKTSLTRIKVPVGAGIPRYLKLPERQHYVPLESIIANNLDMLLPEMEVVSCEVFRVTRNANTERSEEHADDLLSLIESELRDRRFAPIVRLQVQRDMAPVHRGMLAAELFLDEENDVFEIISMPAMRDLFEIASLDIPELRDPPHKAIDH